jgi:NADH-quinone oxidoreductase subunit E
MAMRRLAEVQPESFAFTQANAAWAKQEVAKYPEGRQASAVIALLWRAQDQEGWVTEPAIEVVAEMLEMPKIRVLEVATFYTMFNLEPVGRIAHIQVCGTTPCWLRGANDLKEVCRNRINHEPFHLSSDGAFSWEEVECLGACVNAPMVLIASDTYEDLTAESFSKLIDDLAAGKPVKPGPEIDRQFAAPVGGPTTLTDPALYARENDNAPPAPAGEAAVSEADKPEGLPGPRDSNADDLKRISGIGPKIEEILNSLGVYHFDQIAAWEPRQLAWVDDFLSFKGRILREDWIGQAKDLAKSAPQPAEADSTVEVGEAPIDASKPQAAAPRPPDPNGQLSQQAEKDADGQSTKEEKEEKVDETDRNASDNPEVRD